MVVNRETGEASNNSEYPPAPSPPAPPIETPAGGDIRQSPAAQSFASMLEPASSPQEDDIPSPEETTGLTVRPGESPHCLPGKRQNDPPRVAPAPAERLAGKGKTPAGTWQARMSIGVLFV